MKSLLKSSDNNMKNQEYLSKIRAKLWSKFANCCHQAVVEAYRAMLRNPNKYKERKEEKLTARLRYEMQRLELLLAEDITVDKEHYLEDEEILFGEKEAEDVARIDLVFSTFFESNRASWSQKERLIYYGEAKNLSLKDWTKQRGTNIYASQYRGRYIDTGIEKIISGAYSKVDAFLIGYMVNGNAQDNVVALNKLIQRRKLPPQIGLIDKQVPISGYSECYISKNDKGGEVLELQHIFLEFDRVEVE